MTGRSDSPQTLTKEEVLALASAYRRAFNRARGALKALAATEPLRVTASFTQEPRSFSSALAIHDEDALIRAAVLMRHFVGSGERLNVERVLGEIRSTYRDDLPADAARDVEILLNAAAAGLVPIEINGEALTARRIYEIVGDAEYFGSDSFARKFLSELADVPLIGELLRFQFWNYTVDSFAAVSKLHDLVSWAERRERDSIPTVSSSQCIFCLGAQGTFESEEHPFPDGLGNDTILLPKGYVCDACNNGVLSRLDNYLCNWPPIAFARVQHVPHNKRGQLPWADLGGGVTMKKVRPNHIVINTGGREGVITDERDLGDGQHAFTFRFDAAVDARMLGRALCKIALGLIALDHGPELARSDRYRRARAFVLGKSPLDSVLAIGSSGGPDAQVTLRYLLPERGTPVVATIFGIVFALNLEEHPKVDVRQFADQDRFAVYSLRNGRQLTP